MPVVLAEFKSHLVDPPEPPAKSLPPPPPSEPVKRDVGDLEAKGRAMLYAATWPGEGEGQRNTEAYRHAADLLVDFALDENDAMGILLSWDNKNDPSLGAEELRQVCKDAAKYGKHAPGAKLDQQKPRKRQSNQDGVDSQLPAFEPVFVCMENVIPKPVSWLWTGRFPRAMLSLLIGIEGKGKTFVALDMAARITMGRPWPDSTTEFDTSPVGNMVFLTSEDHLEFTVRPRLDAAGADSNRVFALQGVKSREGDAFFDIMQHLPALEKMIQVVGDVRLVIVDPLTAYLGSVDQHKNGEVRVALSRFSNLAEKYSCSVLGISHLNKDVTKQAIHRTIGSVAFSAAARAVWLVSEDQADPDRRLLVPVKMNLARMARSLAFKIDNMAVAWEAGQFDYQADEVLAVDGHGEERGALADASQWLQSVLSDGRVRSAEIFRMGKTEGFSKRTLDRAKGKIKVRSEKEGIGNTAVWYWRTP